MKLTNDSYLILIGTRNFTERYFRDKNGWLKVSSRGRKFRMTAEQVLNHLLPAAAGVKPGVRLEVKYRPIHLRQGYGVIRPAVAGEKRKAEKRRGGGAKVRSKSHARTRYATTVRTGSTRKKF